MSTSSLPFQRLTPPPANPFTRKIYMVLGAFLTSLTSALLGYEMAIMGAVLYFLIKANTFSFGTGEAFISVGLIFSSLGAFAASVICNKWGYRRTIITSLMVYSCGTVAIGFGKSTFLTFFGRVLTGLAIGCTSTISPIFMKELYPPSYKGLHESLPDVSHNLGMVLGSTFDYLVSKDSNNVWRFLISSAAIPSSVAAVVVFFMEESPRWLMMQGRVGDATKVVMKIGDTDQQIPTLDKLKDEANIPRHITAGHYQVTEVNVTRFVWRNIYRHPTPSLRRMMICAGFVNIFHQFIGLDTLLLYTPELFDYIHEKVPDVDATSVDSSFITIIIVGITKVATTLLSTFVFDKVPRHQLMFRATACLFVAMFLLSFGVLFIEMDIESFLGFGLHFAVGFCIICIVITIVAYTLGPGSMPWIFNMGVFPQIYQLHCTSFAAGINRFASGLMSVFFLSLCKSIAVGGAIFLLAMVVLAGLPLFLKFFPNTQNTNHEELEEAYSNSIQLGIMAEPDYDL